MAVDLVLAADVVLVTPVEVGLLKGVLLEEGTTLHTGLVEPVLDGDLGAVAGVLDVVLVGLLVLPELERGHPNIEGLLDVDGRLVGRCVGSCKEARLQISEHEPMGAKSSQPVALKS